MPDLFSAFVLRLLRLVRRGRQATDATVPGSFASLPLAEQRIATQYLITSARVQSLLDSIRDRKRAVDPDETLTEYARAEADYVAAGFVPFLPSSVKGRVTSCDVAVIERSGLVRKLAADESGVIVVNFAAGIRAQVTRLLYRGDVHVLDSAAAEQRYQEIIAGARPQVPAKTVSRAARGTRSGGHLRLVD